MVEALNTLGALLYSKVQENKTSSEQTNKENYSLNYMFSIDGTKVYKFDDNGSVHYLAISLAGVSISK